MIGTLPLAGQRLLCQEGVALVGLDGFVLFFLIDLKVGEVASLLNSDELCASFLLGAILLGAGKMVGELQFLVLGVEYRDPLVFETVSDNEKFTHRFVVFCLFWKSGAKVNKSADC